MRGSATLLALAMLAGPAAGQDAQMPIIPPFLLRDSVPDEVNERVTQGLEALDTNPVLAPAWTVPPTAPQPPPSPTSTTPHLNDKSIGQRIEKGLTAAGEPPTSPPDYAYGAFQRGYFLTAFAIALERAKQGDRAAQTLLGMLLSRGLGVKQDFDAAAGWYEIAAKNGDPEALYALGRMYLEGRGVEKSAAKAADYFQQAGEAGHAVGWRELAYLMLKGEGREKNAMLAAAYMRRAAREGDMDAQYALGGLFVEGVGVVEDLAQAARWYAEAARNGHVGAQVEYAIMLFNGRGVPTDEETAARWLQQAANSDNPLAQTRLARLYAEGRGVKANVALAARWYLIAKGKGFRDEFMDNWLVGQSEKTLREADAAAARWNASNFMPHQTALAGETDDERGVPAQPGAGEELLPPEPETTGSVE